VLISAASSGHTQQHTDVGEEAAEGMAGCIPLGAEDGEHYGEELEYTGHLIHHHHYMYSSPIPPFPAYQRGST